MGINVNDNFLSSARGETKALNKDNLPYWDNENLKHSTFRMNKNTMDILKEFRRYGRAVETRERIANIGVLQYIDNALKERGVNNAFSQKVELELKKATDDLKGDYY